MYILSSFSTTYEDQRTDKVNIRGCIDIQTTKSIILTPRKLCSKPLRCVLQLVKGSLEPCDRSTINAKDFLDFINAISGDF